MTLTWEVKVFDIERQQATGIDGATESSCGMTLVISKIPSRCGQLLGKLSHLLREDDGLQKVINSAFGVSNYRGIYISISMGDLGVLRTEGERAALSRQKYRYGL